MFPTLIYLPRPSADTQWRKTLQVRSVWQVFQTVIDDWLKRHLLIHTNRRPFKCTQCEKCFRLSSYLQDHLQIHSAERPFKCALCEKCFTRKQTLFYHKRKFHSDSPHKCESCCKDFTDDNALKRHDCEKRSARDKETFTCWMCDEYCYDHCGYLYHCINTCKDKWSYKRRLYREPQKINNTTLPGNAWGTLENGLWAVV